MASGMPLSYLSRSYVEPSAPAGVDRLGAEPLLARPSLSQTGGARRRGTRNHKRRRVTRGGFSPSIMGSFVQNAAMLTPAAGITCYRMIKNFKGNNTKKTKKSKKSKKTKKNKSRK